MNVVVTGGGTIAPIDDVRLIANRSSGRFAAEISESCLTQGATVWHIHTPAALRPWHRRAVVDLDADEAVEATRIAQLRKQYRASRDRLHLVSLAEGRVEEYARALRQVLQARPIDIVFLTMAVSDFEPDAPAAGKIDSAQDELVVRCRPTPKIIQSVRDWAPDVYLVGFKLLSGAPEERLIDAARQACAINRADLTVANDYQSVRAGRHRILLVRPDQPVEAFGPDEPPAPRLVERAFTWARQAIGRREPIPLDGGD